MEEIVVLKRLEGTEKGTDINKYLVKSYKYINVETRNLSWYYINSSYWSFLLEPLIGASYCNLLLQMFIIIVMVKCKKLQKIGLTHQGEDMFFSTFILYLKRPDLK